MKQDREIKKYQNAKTEQALSVSVLLRLSFSLPFSLSVFSFLLLDGKMKFVEGK